MLSRGSLRHTDRQGEERERAQSAVSRTVVIVFGMLSVLAGISVVIWQWKADSSDGLTADSVAALDVLTGLSGRDARAGRPRLVFLVRFGDFTCPPCYESFVNLVRDVGSLPVINTHGRALLVFTSEGLGGRMGWAKDSLRLAVWAQANDIRIPFVLGDDSLFHRFGFTKTCVVVRGPDGSFELEARFPVTHDEHKSVLRSIVEGS